MPKIILLTPELLWFPKLNVGKLSTLGLLNDKMGPPNLYKQFHSPENELIPVASCLLPTIISTTNLSDLMISIQMSTTCCFQHPNLFYIFQNRLTPSSYWKESVDLTAAVVGIYTCVPVCSYLCVCMCVCVCLCVCVYTKFQLRARSGSPRSRLWTAVSLRWGDEPNARNSQMEIAQFKVTEGGEGSEMKVS